MKVTLLLSMLLSGLAFADGQVLVFPAVGTPSQVTVSGRVFTEPLGSGGSPLSRNLRSLLAPNWKGAHLQVRFAGQTTEVVSGHDGNWEAVFTAPKEHPFTAGLQRVEAKVKGAAAGGAEVDVISDGAPFFVVSDFDDTLAVTEVLKKGKLLEHAIAQDADSQPLVEGMPQLMRCLREGKAERPVFALVSGSPVQFVPRTQAFLFKHDFPPFGLYLRDLGPQTLRDYKQPIIRALLQSVPHDVVLVGDSGEHDPEVYGQMRAEFPERVKAIAIHDVGRLEDPARAQNMLVFKHPRDIFPELIKRRLIAQSCANAAFR
ncbi:MAG: DUF2183 domain-containing protein [Archangiaceae bacterium]|nr:DUF2183 domain-containing protein [Archangiaceae bacterium]